MNTTRVEFSSSPMNAVFTPIYNKNIKPLEYNRQTNKQLGLENQKTVNLNTERQLPSLCTRLNSTNSDNISSINTTSVLSDIGSVRKQGFPL